MFVILRTGKINLIKCFELQNPIKIVITEPPSKIKSRTDMITKVT